MLNSFLQLIKKRALFDEEDKLLLAVSGGVDSMVLLQLISTLDVAYAVAHCNFQLRGAESDSDEELVRKTAATLGVSCHLEKCDTDSYATINKVSTQMAARDLRYAWFDELCKKHGYTKIVLAHHANDNVETFLLNMVRGTSIKGQKGMGFSTGRLVRPLLDFSKEEILTYARAENVAWRDDLSNDQTYYKRNFVRKEIVPRLEELNPDLLYTMKRNMARNNEIFQLSQKVISSLKERMVLFSSGRYAVNKQELEKNAIGPYVLSQLLEDFGFNYAQCEDVLLALDSSGKTFGSLSHKLIVDRSELIIQEKALSVDHEFFIGLADREMIYPMHYEIEQFQAKDFELDRSPCNAMLDFDKLVFPLKIRKWKEGDKFRPLGMKGKKLVSDLLIDLKLSMVEKESTYVLESESEIAWVLGLRISDEFKVNDKTKRLIYFKEVDQ